MKTEDPRAIFQAMKPIFNDLVTEIPAFAELL